jgi:hypothetical protein
MEDQLELAYRRGYAHGYSLSSQAKNDEEYKENLQKIHEWRHDINNPYGSPGSMGEKIILYHREKIENN